MHREHPLRIARYSKKSIWLLIFPILRGAYHIATREELLAWLRGTWFDVLILCIILAYGWLNWYRRVFTVENEQLYVREGIIFIRQRYLPLRNLASMTVERPFWLRPVRASYLCADTASGLLDTTDIRLMIRQRDEHVFLSALPRLRQGKRHHMAHRGGTWRMIFFSMIFSSSFSGAVYLAVFWFQSGRIAGDLIEEWQLRDKLSTVSEDVAAKLAGIPPAAVTVGIIILSTWLLSFVRNLLRYGGFSMESDRRMLVVRSGLLTRRRFWLVNRKINFADIQQNLLTKFCRIFSLAVSCPGYGSRQGSIPICMPILTQREMDEVVPMIFPDIRLTKNTLRPHWLAWWGYVNQPVCLAAAVVPAAEIVRRLYPPAAEAVDLFRVMLLIPIFWKLAVQITSLVTTGVSISDGRICARFCRGTTFHTIIADTDNIVKVRIYQHFWQRWSGGCHLVLYFRSESGGHCTVRSLNYEMVRKTFSQWCCPPAK